MKSVYLDVCKYNNNKCFMKIWKPTDQPTTTQEKKKKKEFESKCKTMGMKLS